MKLYYSPGACSLAPHILIEQLNLDYEGIPVNLGTHTYPGGDYYQVNPKGAVPALRLDDGDLLTENAVILQYLADRKPEARMLPPVGSPERYHALEWLNYIATELHKSFAPFFRPDTPEEYKKILREGLGKKFAYVAQKLGTKPFLLGDNFSAPDAYLFVMLTWAGKLQIDTAKWPALTAFIERVKGLPGTRRAFTAEGLS